MVRLLLVMSRDCYRNQSTLLFFVLICVHQWPSPVPVFLRFNGISPRRDSSASEEPQMNGKNVAVLFLHVLHGEVLLTVLQGTGTGACRTASK